ncbi:MAG: pentapeptide repeat-containing protein [Kiritimatiellaeota bacterium]|nr:pentapeptide repeat-containing protein [Kiritimatiellota bacterium]
MNNLIGPRGKLCPSSVVCRLSSVALLAFMLTLTLPVQADTWIIGQVIPFNIKKRVQTVDTSAAKMTREQCLDRARSRRINTDLQGAKLNDADLSNVVLLSADMREANLKKTILTKATLCRANLSVADMEGAVLNEADLSGATLVNAKLKGANLVHAKLCNATLMGADLTGAILTEANLSCANLTGVILTGAILLGTDLSGANLQGAVLSQTNQLDKAVLSKTILPNGTVHP